jgi:hypothetical protein
MSETGSLLSPAISMLQARRASLLQSTCATQDRPARPGPRRGFRRPYTFRWHKKMPHKAASRYCGWNQVPVGGRVGLGPARPAFIKQPQPPLF